MIVKREPDELTSYFIAFHTRWALWWVPYLCPGRFKHVAVFAFSAACRTWVFQDFNVASVRTMVAPEGKDSELLLAQWTADAAVLHMRQLPRTKPRFPVVFGCVGAVKHLMGLRGGALSPDGLWKLMIANGATIVIEPQSVLIRSRPAQARPGDRRAAEAG